MFKNSILRYLNSAAFFDRDSEGSIDPKEAARLERESIQTNESISSDTEKQSENEQDDDKKNENEEEKDNTNEEEDNNENKENAEETDEQKETRLAAEKEARRQARQQRKWDKLAAEKTAAENKVKELEAKLKENPVEGLTEEEVERRAEAKAAIKLAEKQQQEFQTNFEARCEKLENKAKKINENFVANLEEMVEEIGTVPGAVIDILDDLDNENGAEVLNHLVTNVDDAEDIFAFKGNVKKLTMKLMRLSDKLKSEGDHNKTNKKPARQVSNVPPPIKPVNGNGNDLLSAPITGKEDMDSFVAKRNRQIEERRKNRGY